MALRRGRPDPSEQAYDRLTAPAAPYEPLPAQLRRFDLKRWLLYAVLLFVVVAVFRDGVGRGAPEVDGACDRPAFALDKAEVDQDAPVKWAVKGPTGDQVVITANSASPSTGRVLGPLPLEGCAADGLFGASLPDGEHVIRVFLLRPDGSHVVLGQKVLTVNAPR